MLKKIFCMFAVLCLLFTFAACSSKDADKADNDQGDYELIYSLDKSKEYYTVTGVEGEVSGKLVIPEKYKGIPVTYIGESAFEGQDKMTSITLPDTIVGISDGAFSGCTALEKINIPVSVREMGSDVFAKCGKLVIKLDANQTPESWGEDWADGAKTFSFGSKALPDAEDDEENTENTEKNNNTTNSTNNGSNNTQTITYSEGLAFEWFSYGVTEGYAVKGVGTCKDEHIRIPETYKGRGDNKEYEVVAILDGAFKNATFIKAVTIPDSVVKIGTDILAGCSNIESITTPLIGADGFSYDVLGYFFGANAFDGAELISQQTMTGYNASLKLKDYYIPTSLRTINLTKSDYCYGMFSGCYFLTSVNISYDDAESPNLGNYAFYGCKGLTQIKISGKIDGIGDFAFANCENLESVVFDDDLKSNGVSYSKLKEIGDYAFKNCKKLKSFTIPESVKEIGSEAFAGCESLTSITIPAYVTYVGANVVDSGCKSLTSIRALADNNKRFEWASNWNGTTIQPSYN